LPTLGCKMTDLSNQRREKRRFWKSIQGQLILLLLVLLIPTLLVQAHVFNEWYKTEREAELQANLQIARAVAKNFESFAEDVLHHEYALGIALTLSQPPSDEQRRYIEENFAERRKLFNLLWVSPDGVVLISHLREVEGQSISDRKHFQNIVAGRDWAVSDLVSSISTGEPIISLARGIRDKQGRLLGVVVASILSERLDEVLAIERPKGGGHALVDSKGMLVYRYPWINATWEERNWLKDYPDLKETLAGKEVVQTVYAPYEGKNRLVAFAPVPSIGWVATAGRTEEIAMAAVVSQLFPQAVLLFAIALAAFGAALLCSRFIANPVKRLQEYAMALGRGQNITLDLTGPLELKELGGSFKEMVQALKFREEKIESLARFPDENTNPVLRVSEAGELLYANRNSSHLLKSLGWEPGRKIPRDWLHVVQEVVNSREKREIEVICGDLLYTLLLAPISDSGYLNIYGTDITERRRIEREREITLELLEIINHSTGTADLVEAAATFFQRQSGCEAVGMRLKQGEDFPYFEARGFPEEFIRMENSLCSRDSAGNILRDSSGNPYIECMCGNVILGRVDQSKPFFSRGGSFWTNSTTRLLATTSDAERQTRTRNRCNGEGYESVALIPLYLGSERMGLIQLNDRRQDRFSPEIIDFWERLAGYFSVALARAKAEEQLSQQREWFQVTLTSVGDAVIATDTEGKILFINPVAEALTGWPNGEALTAPVQEVFRIIDEKTRGPAEDVINQVLRKGCLVALANHTALITRDGREIPIEDSAAPIRDSAGNVSGVVLVFHDVTDRRRAQEALQESEERLRIFIEHAPASLAMFDRDMRYLSYSRRWLSDYNLGDRELRGLSHYDVFPEIDETWKRVHIRALAGEVLSADDERFVRADGSVQWLRWEARPWHDSAGDVAGMVIFSEDITERKRAENETQRLLTAVQEEKERLSTLINSISDEIWFSDTEKRFTLANPAALRGFGLENSDGMDVEKLAESLEVYRPDGSFRPVEEAPPLRALEGESVRNMEEVIRNPSTGELRHRQVSSSPVRDANGDIVGAVSVVRDITERKQMEDELRRSESEFKLLSDVASNLLASENPQGLVNELCRAVMVHLDCHTFFNFLVDELAGRLHLNAFAGIPEEEAAKIEWLDFGVAVCGCAARDGERIVAEDIFNTPDIRTDLVRSYGIQAYACHPLKVGGGRVIGTLSFGTKSRTIFTPQELAVMKTVADQVAVAMERIGLIEGLRKARDELEVRVEERTAELARYMARLEESNQALQDFASIASHDLQEPLRKVESFGSMLKQKYGGQLGEQGNGYIERLIDANKRMRSLITALLEYSRLTTKASPITEVGLTGIVNEVLSDLEVRIERTGGKVHLGDLPVIEADPTQMRQLFQNLIGNALKFHKEGEQPFVKVSSSTMDNGDFQIVVEDNGIGFEEQYAEKIFSPFQRLHGRSSQYKGTGMGLAICRKIVERHGGTISAESEPGKGSTFIVRLPAKQSELRN